MKAPSRAIVATMLGATVGTALALIVSRPNTDVAHTSGGDANTSSKALPPNRPVCGQGPSAVLGYIGSLQSGAAVTSVEGAGYKASAVSGSATQSLIVISVLPTTTQGNASPQVPVPHSPALRSVAAVVAEAAEPELRSCSLTLSDKPEAQPFITAANQFLTSQGTVSAEQVASSPSYEVSDDPLDSTVLIVTANIRGAQQSGFPNDVPRFAEISYAVIVNRTTHAVTGFAQWPQ